MDASTFGRVKLAVSVCDCPGPKVNVLWLNDTATESRERGTGPAAGEIVPYLLILVKTIGIVSLFTEHTGVTVIAVPAGK